MILDLLATIPTVFSGLNQNFAMFKIIRLYEIDCLHFPFSLIILKLKAQKPRAEADNIIYAVSILAKIMALLHYLSCLWLYVGSEAYLDYEEGY